MKVIQIMKHTVFAASMPGCAKLFWAQNHMTCLPDCSVNSVLPLMGGALIKVHAQ